MYSIQVLQALFLLSATLRYSLHNLLCRKDYRLFATANWDSSISIYSYNRMKCVGVLNQHRAAVYALAFGPPSSCGNVHQDLLAAGSKDSTISLWNIACM